MRKYIATLAAFGVVGLGALTPAAAQPASPSGTGETTSKRCDNFYKNAKPGYVYTFKHSNCRVLVGHAKGNDSSWSKKTNNKVSSIVNKGTGGTSKVKFYVGKKYKGGHICLKRSEKYVDNLSNDKFSTGQSANDAISSHKWVDNNAKCSAYMS